MNFPDKVTPKGTNLPIINLKGKPYLQVAHRLVWFREEHPNGIIKTQILHNVDGSVITRAEVYVLDKNGMPQMVASAHKEENKSNFSDNIEKSETGAVGRALAMCGYGTQFDPELDEGVRLADAPVAVATKAVKVEVNALDTALDAAPTALPVVATRKPTTFRKSPKAPTEDTF